MVIIIIITHSSVLNLNFNDAVVPLRAQQYFKSTGLSEFMQLWRIDSGNVQNESL